MLQKELEEITKWETVKAAPQDADACFSQVEDHVAVRHSIEAHREPFQAYHRATSRRKQAGEAEISQPGPEYETFVDQKEEEELQEVPDSPVCPAAKLLEELEAAALSPKRSSIPEVEVAINQPGPDLGDDEVRVYSYRWPV